MNIGVDLRCLSTPHRTGVGEFTYELLTSLFAADKHNNYFLFFNGRKNLPAPFTEQNNVKYVSFRFPNKIFSVSEFLFSAPKIDKLIEKRTGSKLDFFFSPHLNFTNLSATTKHLLLIHDLTFELFPDFLTTKQRLWHFAVRAKRQAKNAHLILTPSENTKRDLVDYYRVDPEKIKVLPPGLSKIFLQERNSKDLSKYGLPEDFILFLGTIEPRKNIISLIEAFEIAFPKLQKPHHLIIAGAPGWKNKAIKEKIHSSKFNTFIKPIDYVPENEKPSLYKAARLFVYPSFYEGFGFPILEAFASGTPVICSNRSSLVEITGNAARLINPHRPEEIAIGIEKILNSESLRKKMTEEGLRQSQKYSWQTTAENFLKLVK